MVKGYKTYVSVHFKIDYLKYMDAEFGLVLCFYVYLHLSKFIFEMFLTFWVP